MVSVMVVCPELHVCHSLTQCGVTQCAMPSTCWMPAGIGLCGPLMHCASQALPVIVLTNPMPPAAVDEGAPTTPPAAAPEAAPQASVLGRVWALSRDLEGCLLVQAALEDAHSDDQRSRIALELEGHVWDALRCPHANHVLQKFIEVSAPRASQFIVNEIVEQGRSGAQDAARHQYGCRVIQRLLEHCRPEQIEELVGAFLSCAIALSRHEFGNFVMQHVLEQGTPSQRRRLARLLTMHARVMGADAIACGVVTKALEHCSEQDAMALARALACERRLVVRLARSRHGHGAAKAMLRLLEGEERAAMEKQLLAETASIRASRYGKSVLACVSGSVLPKQACLGGA